MQRIPMGPHGAGMGDYGAMMRFPNGMQNDNLQRRALQNRGGLQPYVSPTRIDPASSTASLPFAKLGGLCLLM
jgi:hypothetical protein